jgi:leucyl aminopeptidase
MSKALVVIKDSKQAKALGDIAKRASAQEGNVDISFAHDEYDYITIVEKKPEETGEAWRTLAGEMVGKYKSKVETLNFDTGYFGDAIIDGAELALYEFNKYKTKPKANKLTSVLYGGKETHGSGVASSVNWARDFVSEPGNELYPEEYADRIQSTLTPLGVTVKVYSQRQLEKMGFNLLLSVGQGSDRDSQVVVMEYMNGKKDDAPVALVGKGVTFDSGGISLKPGRGMGDMKYDMGGSAAVVGAMHAISLTNTKRNVVGIVGLVENMPDGKAIKPGDVVTSLSGQTVENLNTDAEGRLVLADILTYVQREYKPATVINLATLTGAIVAALGKQMAGLFTNSTELEMLIIDAGENASERYYRMPMGSEFAKMIESPIADMQNIGGPYAGSTTAAEFLFKFIEKDTAWAHLDIAGMAWEDSGKPLTPKGAVGFGVRTLYEFVNKTGTTGLAIDEDMDY